MKPKDPLYREGDLVETSRHPTLILKVKEFNPGLGWTYDVLRDGVLYENVIQGNIAWGGSAVPWDRDLDSYWYDEA